MRILVIEDDTKVASFIIKGFMQTGFTVDHAANGEDGLHLAVSAPHDVAVVDLMLPRLDGLGLIAKLRGQRINTPVIILSAKRSVDDRVRGLQSGGDDYLIKPFSFAELLARVRALIRRAGGSAEPTRLANGDLSLNLLTREVVRRGKTIELQPREFTLLDLFMRNAGRVMTKTIIMEQLWGYHFDPQTSVVDVLVCRLRNKVDRDFSHKMIQPIRGVGYVIKNA